MQMLSRMTGFGRARATALAALTAATLATGPAAALTIDDLSLSGADPAVEAASEAAARHFYAFWDTGDTDHLDRAIAPGFTDRTLPPGRPQGPAGPAAASAAFRAAVPDLGVEVKLMVISGEYVTTHMVFHGHFTGTFRGVQGSGQEVRFNATDLVRVRDGRITDNWHIEDNLTLLQDMGLVKGE
ncbi:ester cyclase [Oceanicella sp. SM1341]|uniref:ester cyclase n=1 Tax=Oceanicella sp. SM1341 TaxID=1548889 RepID=UPI0018E4DB46|nr:ester cyclase [Oceanicella sp. SM1341]